MRSDFVVWGSAEEQYGCFLSRIEGVEKKWDLSKGAPRAKGFTRDAILRMDSATPDNTMLYDSVDNVNRYIVVSPKLAGLLKSQEISKLEFLPVRIIDHKGKVASSDYSILHPVDPIDCLNQKASSAAWSSVDEDSINSVSKLVLDEQKIPKNREIVRVKHFYRVVLIRRILAERLSGAGVTNVRWIEPVEYRC